MTKATTLRPDFWLLEDLKNYANKNGLAVPSTGEYCFSKALHGLIRDLKTKALEYDKAKRDLEIYRSYMEKLAKETKPFRCGPLNTDMTTLECYQCQSKAKTDVNTPIDVKECPRNRAVTP